MARSYSVRRAENQDDLSLKHEQETLLQLWRSTEPNPSSNQAESVAARECLDGFLADCFQVPSSGRLAGGGLYGRYLRWCDAQRVPTERRMSESLFLKEYGERALRTLDLLNAPAIFAGSSQSGKESGRQAAG